MYILSWSFILIFITTSSPVKGELNLETSPEYKCGKAGDANLLSEGSVITSTSELPWTAAVTAQDNLVPDFTFAALIISPNLLLTSVNRFIPDGSVKYRFLKKYVVFVGTTDLRDHGSRDLLQNNPNDSVQTGEVAHITVHPSFKLTNSWATGKNHIALLHLANPLVLSEKVQPICLPSTSDLQEIVGSPGDENLILSGWHRDEPKRPISLRLSLLPQGRCKDIYEAEPETGGASYENTTCALVGKRNSHTTCVHRAVAAARLINDSYYFAGIISELYSLNGSKICYPGSLYYLTKYSQETHSWIANSIRCGPKNFTCHNGDCTLVSNVCNQESDCSDGSDEDPEFCRGQNFCDQSQFPCGTYGPCILNHKVQDGISDCPNGEDETPTKNYAGIIVGGSVVGFLVIGTLLLLSLYIFVLKNRIRDLTQDEVDEFLHGSIPSNLYDSKKDYEKGCNKSGVVYIGNYDPVQCMPWNNEYEIPFKQLEIMDEINRGNSGIVYKARRLSVGPFGNQSEVVAVKTHISTIGVEKFKALLCELKIIAHVGSHDHIVSFIGACTEHIKTRNVFMVVEYCPEGDLLNHLKKIRNPASVDLSNSRMVLSHTGYVSAKPAKRKIIDQIKWSCQISCGMDYLTTRMVVHGDLAARNVLLSPNLDAKITDFGLSRQLETSKIYVKTTHEAVPWKWLAPESLQHSSFSEKSDVWSFGVLAWEIFTLGQDPYGNKVWGQGFLDSLLQGMRLLQPTYATDEIYEIMRSCWRVSPENRPSFKSLKESFSEILQRADRN